jgi:hypothetical protein
MDSEKIIIELKDLSKIYQNLSPSWGPPVQAKPL